MEKQWYKTKDIAAQLDVAPATVLKWARKHHIPYSENEYGHYCFGKETLTMFLEIKTENQKNHFHDRTEKDVVASSVLLDRMAGAEDKIQTLERLIVNKADDIVTFQLVEQRKKIEALNKQLSILEQKVDNLEPRKEETPAASSPKKMKNAKKLLAGLFLFD